MRVNLPFDARWLWCSSLLLAGCFSPGDYNIGVAVGPPTTTAASAPLPTASATPSTLPASGASPGPTPVVSSAPSTAPASRLDQSQDDASSYQQVGDGTRFAQTFQPGVTGNLVAVGLQLRTDGLAKGSGAVVVRAVDSDGKPADPLGTATIQSANLPDTLGTWTTFKLDSPIPLTSGTPYALVLTLTGAGEFFAGTSSDASYANGTGFTGLTDGSTFWNRIDQDLAFQTYMH